MKLKKTGKMAAVVQPRIVRRWGVYCAAALKADPKSLPRYTYPTKEAAEKSLPQMDRECASKAKHFVKIIPPNVKDHSPIGAVSASNPESNSAAPIG